MSDCLKGLSDALLFNFQRTIFNLDCQSYCSIFIYLKHNIEKDRTRFKQHFVVKNIIQRFVVFVNVFLKKFKNFLKRGYLMFPERLKKLRKAAGMSQKNLALKLNTSQQNINYWENGQRNPKREKLIETADFFDVSVDYLLGNTDEKKPVLETAQILFRKTVDDFNLTKEQQEQFKIDIDNFIEMRRKAFEEEQD
ncbi:XRE family transcriptional regulator [Streptococcus sanguinis SK330]|uniref:XRE family transcriptional regulator n=2 Tax=Streptococcus sanguinis TaxID=1305 RepID=F2CB07_STRSA|nr:XRE family transcriptional regulator [Streptococcus sanguinis SK330]